MDEICSGLFIDDYVRRRYTVVTPDDVEDIKQKMETEGLDLVISDMESKLDGWKSQPLHCGITGSSGTGKSSFINTIRGLTPRDENAASVGVVECTTEPTSYPDPKNPMLQYWDLPGVGTPKFPKDESYLQKIGFERFDFFLIITANRFSENDIWLASQIRKAKKNFFFVRSKIDQDLFNEKRCRANFKVKDVMEEIRNDCVEKLQPDFGNPDIFLISNFDPQKYEFPSLCLKLIDALPQLKKEAMTLSLQSLSDTMIVEKKKILQNRVWYVSLMSAAGACIPFLGASIAIDTALILHELQFYRQQFGISKETLASLSEKVHSDKKNILNNVQILTSIDTTENLLSLFASFSSSMAVEEVSRYILGIGTLISSGLSFSRTYRMLNGQLDQMEKASNEIMALTLETMLDADELD
ncbi:interferon-inducible GTPase 5-like [Hydractinia symbiolongicarpus]|uniref:interferon-inducible GTPase 5-like n=1 Tax=Hydractinia symbiolongicarpus TaxID=13093 RepID=UPI00254ED82E|nr:interferon-inducible GTPase 5-like [Hydractinia symbiolongicarpus]